MSIRTWTPVIGAGLLLVLPAQPVAAAAKHGTDFVAQCQMANNLAVIACHLYLDGVKDVLAENAVSGFRACLPEMVDNDEVVSVVVDWAAQHADEQQKPASDVIAHALSEKYPCT